MSLYVMSFMGMGPLGSLLGGSLASQIGAPHTLIVGGATCLLGSLLFIKKLPSLREMIRPIYIQRGILSEGPK
jgi:predicted MFS family arabinose efflux permease